MAALALSLLAFLVMSLLYFRLYWKQLSPRRRRSAVRPNTLDLNMSNRTEGDTTENKHCDLLRAHNLPAIELTIHPVPPIQSVGSSIYDDVIPWPNSAIPASTVKGVPKHSYEDIPSSGISTVKSVPKHSHEDIIPNSGIPASTVKGVPMHSYEDIDIIPNSGIPASTVKGVPKHRYEDKYYQC